VEKERVAELVGELEGELNNGGFHQFFYNSAGDDTEEIIRALQLIGATKAADIVKRAASKFPGEMPPVDRLARQDLLLDTVAPSGDEFRDLDEEFYSYPDDLSGLLGRYERSQS
jgi:hypothetical protein